MGPNGAHKTTAIRTITGSLPSDSGIVRTFGLDPVTNGEPVRTRCGVVSAKPTLHDRLSGWGYLDYSAALYGVSDNRMQRIHDAGGWFFPTTTWSILMLWVVPPFMCFAFSLVLRLSARVKPTAAAQQASGSITLPLIILAYSRSTGSLFDNSSVALHIGLFAWLGAVISLSRMMATVRRGRLAALTNRLGVCRCLTPFSARGRGTSSTAGGRSERICG